MTFDDYFKFYKSGLSSQMLKFSGLDDVCSIWQDMASSS